MTIKKAKIRNILYVFLIFALIQVSACQPNIANVNSKGTSIICFGDGLTKGDGATEDHDYPYVLSRKLRRIVINAGISGNITQNALERIERDVLELNPKMVIVEFSKNDYLQNVLKKETIDNLDKIVEMIQQRQAMVVLVEVPIGGGMYHEAFEYIAQRRHTLLVTVDVAGNTDEAYGVLAEKVYQAIKPLLD